MSEKIVCQLLNGYFVDTTVADQDPLDPENYLIPANCVDAPPPVMQEGYRYKWNGAGWDEEVAPPAPIPPEPVPPTPPQDPKEICKTDAKILLANTDWSQLADVVGILKNKDEFDAYRTAVRAYVLNPVDNPVWPQVPQADWS
jgi:hypothetical protein